MRYFSTLRCAFILFAISITSVAFAQQSRYNIIAGKKTADGRYNFIKFDSKNQPATAKLSPAEQMKNLFGLSLKNDFIPDAAAKKSLGLKENSKGEEHTRYNQFYNGIKVEYGVVTTHGKNGKTNIITGEYFNIEDNFSTVPRLSSTTALARAIAFVGAQKYSWQDPAFNNTPFANEPKSELVICKNFKEADSDSKPLMELAYKFAIYASEPLRYDYIYVSAKTGNIIHVNPIIKHTNGTAATRYSGSRTIVTTQVNNNYSLEDSNSNYNVGTYNMNRGSNYTGALVFSDNDNNWTSAEYNNTNYDNAALDAHWGAMMTLDYWRIKHNRNSFDNTGTKIKSYVHYGNLYANAFWNGSVMTYGDGNGNTMFPLVSIDICGHEIGHAVCEHTAGLIYSYESGAMNESLSDIWGACIKNYADSTKDKWKLGDEIFNNGDMFRSFTNPKSKNQPDTYKGINWYTGSGDNGGVHYNSGVMNHWFYILTTGKTGVNDNGTSYSVTGIGITKAAEIAYRAENLYLFPAATYADARIFTLQATEDLFGANSNELIQTAEAWNAVGVYDQLAKPYNLSAVFNTNVDLSWSYNSFQTIHGFIIERAVNGNTNFTIIDTVGAAVRSYTDSFYVNNSINQYRMRSYRDTTHSIYSDLASVAVGNAPLIMVNGSYTTCSAVFLDQGGLNNYSNGNFITTLKPATTGNKIKVSFSQFNIGSDYMYVFNGPSTSSPYLGFYSGSVLPPDFESTAPGGELTFQFRASSTSIYPGWVASVSCFLPVAAPTNLTATVDTAKDVHLNWTDNANDETRYVIQRSLNDSLHFLSIATLPANATSYIDSAAPDSSYIFYRVRVYRDSVGSPYSRAVSVVIGNLIIMHNGTLSTCGITFLDPGGFGNYNSGYYTTTITPSIPGNKLKVVFSQFNTGDYLYIYNGPSTASPLLGTYYGSSLPPSLESTSPGGELTFVFNPYYSNTYSGWISYISCFKPVAAPTNLTATVDTAKDVHLNWTDNANDETRYIVERSLNDSLNYLSIASLPANTTSFIDTSAPDNSYLFYRVRAYRDSVGSPYSNKVSIIVGNIFIMNNGSTSSCGITFLDPGGFGNYNSGYYTTTITPSIPGNKLKIAFSQFNTGDYLYIYNGPSTSSPLLGSYYGNTLPPIIESTSPGGELTFVFNAYSNYYTGWISYISCYKPVAAPTNLTATVDTAKDVHLNWTDNANDETRYVIERSLNDSLHFFSIASVSANTTSFIDTSATDNSYLFYRVRAYRDSVGSPYSKAVSVTIGNILIMQNATISTCGITFLDPGGFGNYSSGYYTTTVTPSIPGNKLKIVFSQFYTNETLYIYDGPSTSSPLLGNYYGSSIPPSLESTSPGGELTFVFNAYSTYYPGWISYISCYKPVAAPANLSAVADTANRVQLNWTDNANDETHYVVERSVNAPSKFVVIKQLAANTIQYTDSAAPANSLVYYRVKAYRDTIGSFYSNTARAALGNAPYLMTDSILITCDKVFMDPGGIDVIPEPYTYYYKVTTFKPSVTGNRVRASFSKIQLNGTLRVYNGPNTSSPQIGSYSGYYYNNFPIVDGTGTDGSLTFVYQGYGYADSGWVAQISCYKPVAAPTNLSAVADTANRVQLNWTDNANDETRYVVERSVNAPSKFVVIKQLSANTIQYTDSTAPANSLIFYRVKAYRDTLGSFYSNAVRVALGNAPYLMTDSMLITCDKVFMDPGGVDVIPVVNNNSYYNKKTTFKPSVLGNNIRVVFSKFRLNGYLYVYNGPDTYSPLIGNYSGSYALPPILEGTGADGSLTFVYQGYTYSDSGWVAQVSCYKPVGAPTNLSAVADTANRVQLNWTDNANDETHYAVERSVNAPSKFVVIKQLAANTIQYTDSTAPANSLLYYRVRAYRDTLGSFYSNTARVALGNAPYLMTDSMLITCDKVFMDPGGVDIIPVINNNYYNKKTTFKPSVLGNNIRVVFSKFKLSGSLYVYNGPDTYSPLIGSYSGYYNLPPILEGTGTDGSLTFVYQGYPNTDSGWVAQVSCYKPVATPTNLTASADASKKVHLSWTDNSNDETGFVVERSVNDTINFISLVVLTANSTTYIDSIAPDNSLIFYRVKARRDSTYSPYSNNATVLIGNLYIMQNATVSTCGLTFLDPGGYGNYSSGSNYITTFTPSVSGKKLKVVFSQFGTENCCDYLNVYDGPNTSSPLIGNYRGNTLPPNIQSTGVNGELTFAFHSDGSVTESGWIAYVNCIGTGDTLATCSTNSNDVNTLNSNLSGTSYQWQKYSPTGFVNIYNDVNTSGTTTASLQIKNSGLTIFEKFRCVVNGNYSREYVIIKGNRWTGAQGTDWNNAQNWSCGSVPGINTDVLIEGGLTNYPAVNNNAECGSLKIQSGGNINITPGFNLYIRH